MMSLRGIVRSLAVSVGVGIASTGCEGLMGCTDAGCGPSILVRVEGLEDAGEPIAMLHVEGEEPRHMSCDGTEFCTTLISDTGIQPEEFTVTIEVGDTIHSRTFNPVYRISRPNGAGCSPQCRQTEVTFTVE